MSLALRSLYSNFTKVSVLRVIPWTVGIILLSPIVLILWGVLTGDRGESWSHISEYLLTPALINSGILVVSVSILSLLFGIPAAWCVSNYSFPGRRLLSVLLVLPLAIPPYIAAYVTTEAREGLIPLLISIRKNQGIEEYLLAETVLRFAFLSLILAAVFYPYVYLACRAVFSGQSRNLGEASRLLGAGFWSSFFKIQLPLVRPALIAGLFLVTMEVLSDYGAAKHFGISTLTVTIFRVWFSLDELNTARYLSGLILLGVFSFLILERWQRGRARFQDSRDSRLHRAPASFKTSFMSWVFCLLPISLGFIYPVATLIKWAIASYHSLPLSTYLPEIKNTLLLAPLVTLFCLLSAAIMIGYARFSRHRSDQALSSIVCTAGYASPGTVMAVGVLGIATIARDWFPPSHWLGNIILSSSLLWLVFALTARYLTVSGQLITAGYKAIPNIYDHSSRTLGRNAFMTFILIHIPLLRGPIIASAVLVFVDVCKELPLTLLLRPFDFETLGTSVYSLSEQGQIFSTATPSLILISLSAGGLFFIERFGLTK